MRLLSLELAMIMIWEKIKALEEMKENIQKEIEDIEKELKELPSGHLEVKNINNNKYYYLRYWEEGKLKSKYVGRVADDIKRKLSRAEDLRSRLTKLKEEERKITNILSKIEKIITNY